MSEHNNFYMENKNPFGSSPVKVVVDILKYLKSGTVLELGAGDGRNAIFLASKGFKVTAQDISEIGLKLLIAKAKEKSLDITTELGDAAETEITDTYEVIVVASLLHFLIREKALQLIGRIQSQTNPGGLNAMTVITAEGDFFRDNPDTNQFFPRETELLDLYAGWEILEYDKVETRVVKKKPDGSQMYNFTERLLVRKKGNK